MSRVHVPDEAAAEPAGYVFTNYAAKITRAAMKFSQVVYDNTSLSLREMEAARYRTALINGCLVCQQGRAARDFDKSMAGGKPWERPMTSRGDTPDESFYEAVHDWRNSKLFSARERLAIEYAERLGESPKSMEGDEVFWAAMHENFSDDEIVDMSFSIGSWMSMGRVTHALELDTVCAPVHLQQSA